MRHWFLNISGEALDLGLPLVLQRGRADDQRALETHVQKARAAGVSEDEIKHALLLLIPTAGFPAFMKSYAVFKGIK